MLLRLQLELICVKTLNMQQTGKNEEFRKNKLKIRIFPTWLITEKENNC